MKLSTIAVTGLVGVAFITTPVAASAAPAKPNRTGEPTCTYDQKRPGRPAEAKRPNKKMDCIVVVGRPSEDGRAALRRSLLAQNRADLKKNGIKPLIDHKETTRKPTS